MAGPLRARPAFQPTDPMSTLRALLLTDVVDSTKLTEALGDAAMADLWVAHDRAARDLLPTWRGREIDKTDGMLLMFDSAADAVGYALAYHRALATLKLPFTARAGIHVGPVSLRANSADDIARGAKPVEVDGLALPIAARVMSIALGRQTLLSTDARLALGVARERVQSHGHWRLHGVLEPVELFEIGDADAPFAAPPDAGKAYRVVRQGELWQPVRQIKHSLPAERDSFVGRQEPLLALAKKLEDGARLVSVLGMGGTGKTRLVTRFAWSWLGEFPGGVWFCDLSQARSADGIFFAVAQGLDVPLGKADPAVQLAHAINGRGQCLVILDNFEQVARHAEETLGRWLDRAAQAKFIVTTREVLGIVGEETMALAPLPASDAAALFLRRAESARLGYRPGADDLAAIEQLVKVLDGLPLAIELAAARVRVMPPRTLLARMNERFKVLWSKGGRHDRQATLRAAFDWSWELLSEPEKAALAQLSVFEGGFTLESAEAVLVLTGTSHTPGASDAVQWLVDKSFVRQVSDDRFDLLESVREYAAEHLRTELRYAGSGTQASELAHARHRQYFSRFDEQAAIADRCAEANNLVAACRRGAADADHPSAVGALYAAWMALRLTGPASVGARLAVAVSVLPGLTQRQLALTDWVAGSALDMLGDSDGARSHFNAGLTRAVQAGDCLFEARLHASIGSLCATSGELAAALDSLTKALTLATRLGDRALECVVLNSLGRLANDQGNLSEALTRYEAALNVARVLGDRRMEGGLLGNLGGLHHDAGRIDIAKTNYEQALSIAQQVGDRRWEGNARCNLGLIEYVQGHFDRAGAQFKAASTIAQEVGHAKLTCTSLCNLGLVLEAQGDLAKAADCYERAVDGAREHRDRRSEGQFKGHLGLAYARMGRNADALEAMTSAENLLVQVNDRLSLALLLCQRGEAEQLAGNFRAFRETLSRCEELAAELGQGPKSELSGKLRELQQSLLNCHS